ncbi:MAG: hypothetical protein J2P25_12475 [Nocardiopsaceae bacterium]|nr:hypothetical protein [Nocardiopsaceae bacterium]
MSSTPLENVPNPAGQPYGGNPEEPGAISSEWDQLTSGVSAAPVPTVSSGLPKPPPPPEKWLPPAMPMDDGYTVYSSHLITIADLIKSKVSGLEKAIGDLRSAWNSGALRDPSGGGLVNPAIMGEGPAVYWSTGRDFGVMMNMIPKGFISAATQIADIHVDAVRKLIDTATVYGESENRNYKVVKGADGEGFGGLGGNAREPGAPPVLRQVVIKPGSLAPTDTTTINWQDIMSVLHHLEPGPCREAGGLLLALGGELNQVAQQVADGGDQLALHWQGQAAEAALKTFEKMHGQAAALAAEAIQAGNVLSWVGNDVFPVFKAIPSPGVASGLTEDIREAFGAWNLSGNVDYAGYFKAQQVAQQYLTALDNYLVQAHHAIPSPIARTPGS